MAVLAVPYHLDERLDALEVGLPVDETVTAELGAGGPWDRMAVLHEQVADAVARHRSTPFVVSSDCTTSLGVLAGLQRTGRDPGIVWFDAHADFHTEDTTTSGYLGGMPLALAVGRGRLTLPGLLGLRAVPEDRVVLVNARDTDPGEQVSLDRSAVATCSVADLTVDQLPPGELYLHVDLDVCDPSDVPDLLFPAPGGPALDAVLRAVRVVGGTGRVVGVGVGATWRQAGGARRSHERVVQRLHAAAGL